MRVRIMDLSESADADLGAQFFDPNALADVSPTPVISPARTTQPQPTAAQQVPDFPFKSASVSTRAESLSPPLSRLRQPPQAPSFRQQLFEPLIDDSGTSPPNLPAALVLTTARTCDWTVADSKTPSECPTPPVLEPASAVGLKSKNPDPFVISPGDRFLAPAAVGGQPTADNQQALTPGMATLNPSSAYRLTGQRSVTQEQAKEQQKIIEQKLSRANQPSPPYDFVDLIGKGSFGRVYLGYAAYLFSPNSSLGSF